VELNPQRIIRTERLSSAVPSAVLYRVTEDEHGTRCTPELMPLPEHQKLEHMQQAVGGKVEHIYIGASRHRNFVTYDGWVNEEGHLVGLPRGLRVRSKVGVANAMIDFAGSLLVTAGESLSGETVPLTPDEIRDLVLIIMAPNDLPVVSVARELSDA
jgi:hypothetical protein